MLKRFATPCLHLELKLGFTFVVNEDFDLLFLDVDKFISGHTVDQNILTLNIIIRTANSFANCRPRNGALAVELREV